MQIRILQTSQELCSIADDWTRLVESLPAAVPFQLPSWMLTWWKHFGSGELQVLTCTEGDTLAGVIPLFRHRWQDRNQLTLMGSGISDWTDPAIAPDAAADVLHALEDYLATDSQWQTLDWQDLSANTPLRQLQGATARDDIPCLETRLHGTFEDFFNNRSKELRRNVRRYGQRARDRGPLDFEVASDPRPELLDALIRLHELRWQKRGEPGMIAANRAQTFLRDVAEQFATRGMLRIFTVRWSGAVAALVLTILHRRKIFGYMSAFDPEHESLGFGRILLYESLRHCFDQGFTAWNFLRGAEPYKASWGAVQIPKIRLYQER